MRRARESLPLIVLLALLLRLVVVLLVVGDQLDPSRDFFGFGAEAGRIARSLALGKGFASPLLHQTGPTAWMAPVYPWLLSCVFRLTGVYTKASALAILSLNSLFSALTCLPIFYLARKSFGRVVAVQAAWVWALFPYAFDIAADRIWEFCLSTLFLTVLFALTLYLEQGRNPAPWAGYGILWGLATLTNPVVLSVFPVLAGWILYRLLTEKKDWVKPIAVCTFSLFMIVAPWMLRNYKVFHRWVPIRDNFWLEMWVGNSGDTSDWFPVWIHPSVNVQELGAFERLGEIGYMDQKHTQTVALIRSHPGAFVLTTLRRFIFTWTGCWSLNLRYLSENHFDPPNIFFSTTLTILMLLGLRRAFRGARAFAALFALALVSYPAIYYLTHAAMFYRHPVDPEIVILAVLGLHRGFDKPDPRQERTKNSESGSELHMPT